jgi:hypothetical protein
LSVTSSEFAESFGKEYLRATFLRNLTFIAISTSPDLELVYTVVVIHLSDPHLILILSDG